MQYGMIEKNLNILLTSSKNYNALLINVSNLESNIRNIKKRLYEIKNDQVEYDNKVQEIIKLSLGQKRAEQEYKELVNQKSEQQVLFQNAFKDFENNLVDYRNYLLDRINKIQDDIKDNSFDLVIKDRIINTIRDVNLNVATIGIENLEEEQKIKLTEEFNNIKSLPNIVENLEVQNFLDDKMNQIVKIQEIVDCYNQNHNKFRENDNILTDQENIKHKTDSVANDVVENLESDINKDHSNDESKLESSLEEEPKMDKKDKEDDLDYSEPIEVVKTSKWDWVKKHKKKILITAGLSLVGVAVVVGLNQLIPAITNYLEANQISVLSNSMLHNGSLWQSAIPTEQLSLHSANTSLASQIQTITGNAANYTPSTGNWTIGGETLNNFAQIAQENVANAMDKLSTLKTTVGALSLGGLSLTGVGLIAKEKSSKIIEFENKFKMIKNDMSVDDLNKLKEEININSYLTEEEKLYIDNKINKEKKKQINHQKRQSYLEKLKNKLEVQKEIMEHNANMDLDTRNR